MNNKDPLTGGLVCVPGNVITNAHVLMANNTWRLRWEVGDDLVRDYHGGAVLGTGQIIPLDAAKIVKPWDWKD